MQIPSIRTLSKKYAPRKGPHPLIIKEPTNKSPPKSRMHDLTPLRSLKCGLDNTTLTINAPSVKEIHDIDYSHTFDKSHKKSIALPIQDNSVNPKEVF